MTNIYVQRGLDISLARQVAEALTAKDAFATHARDELGLSAHVVARPIQAALTSAVTFAFGAAIAALQLITPGRLRARVAAVYLLVVNLTGVGLGGTVTALVTDHILHDERRVGTAMASVAAVVAPLAAAVLYQGLRGYRRAQLTR